MTTATAPAPLDFVETVWTHDFTNTEVPVFVSISEQTGDRYLLHPPGIPSGYWHPIAERDYVALAPTATERLPGVPLGFAYDLASAAALCDLDHAEQVRVHAIAAGAVSADDPWTVTRTEHRLQRLARYDDGTQKWQPMYTLPTNEDPARTMRGYGSNPYRRVVSVKITETITPL